MEMIATYARQFQGYARSLAWSGPLLMRLVFGFFWLETGWAKWHNLGGSIERFGGWGIPYPDVMAVLSVGTELIGGLCLMLGLFTRLVSAALLFNMIIAITVVAIKDVTGIEEFVELDEVVYILIFYWLIVAGPGRVSVDALIARKLGVPPQE